MRLAPSFDSVNQIIRCGRDFADALERVPKSATDAKNNVGLATQAAQYVDRAFGVSESIDGVCVTHYTGWSAEMIDAMTRLQRQFGIIVNSLGWMQLLRGYKITIDVDQEHSLASKCQPESVADFRNALNAMMTHLNSGMPKSDNTKRNTPIPRTGKLVEKPKRRARTAYKRPLTARQAEAIKLEGECRGDVVKAAEKMGVSHSTYIQHREAAYAKLPRDARPYPARRPIKQRLPTDKRGAIRI